MNLSQIFILATIAGSMPGIGIGFKIFMASTPEVSGNAPTFSSSCNLLSDIFWHICQYLWTCPPSRTWHVWTPRQPWSACSPRWRPHWREGWAPLNGWRKSVHSSSSCGAVWLCCVHGHAQDSHLLPSRWGSGIVRTMLSTEKFLSWVSQLTHEHGMDGHLVF